MESWHRGMLIIATQGAGPCSWEAKRTLWGSLRISHEIKKSGAEYWSRPIKQSVLWIWIWIIGSHKHSGNIWQFFEQLEAVV